MKSAKVQEGSDVSGDGYRQQPYVKRQRSLIFGLHTDRTRGSPKSSLKSTPVSPTVSASKAPLGPTSPQLDSSANTNELWSRRGPVPRSTSNDSSYKSGTSQNSENPRYKPSEASRLRLIDNGYNNANTTNGRHPHESPALERFSRHRRPSVGKKDGSPPISRNSSSFSVHAESENPVFRGFPVSPRERGLSASSSRSTSLHPSTPLRPSASLSEFTSTRPLYQRQRNAVNFQGARPVPSTSYTDAVAPGYRREQYTMTNLVDDDDVRAGYRSALTNTSSFFGTERSSILTKSSSTSNFGKDEGMTVDDAIGMYESGFADSGAEDGYASRPDTSLSHRSDQLRLPEPRSDSLSNHVNLDKIVRESTNFFAISENGLDGPNEVSSPSNSILTPKVVKNLEVWTQQVGQKLSDHSTIQYDQTRDRYGFRKKSQHVTLAEYEAWSTSYSEYLARRRKKWETLMKESGLSVSQPAQFPPRSTKVKRFVRKGIPPDWRGAAWFWYAGGPSIVEKNPGLYDELVTKATNGGTNPTDEELIERDLNRTFPDNVKFKPDPTIREPSSVDRYDEQSGAEFETPILQALRRVLRAFSIYNPKIGYCQSLNFLAGLLLLFMSEERSFWLLNIITHKYLPGTHEVNLEGANVDLGVLMMSIKESMPSIWARIGGELDGSVSDCKISMRLPPITLCCTAWFMSCFIGILPVESTLRVWDSFFYEGSKTLFRIALAIFKVGEAEIKAVSDPMEIFQVVQMIPRRLVDANALMEACFRRRNGFGHLSQDTIEARRAERRAGYAHERAKAAGEVSPNPKGSIFSKIKGREKATEL